MILKGKDVVENQLCLKVLSNPDWVLNDNSFNSSKSLLTSREQQEMIQISIRSFTLMTEVYFFLQAH